MKQKAKTLSVAIIGILLGGFFRIASAQSTGGAAGSFRDLVNTIGGFISKYIIPTLVAAAFVYFLWNIVHFIANMGNEKEHEEFKKYSINGIIALFLLLSVWGIIGIFSTALFNKPPGIPQFPINTSPTATTPP